MKFGTKKLTTFFATVAFVAALIASGVMQPFKVDESRGMTPLESVLNATVQYLCWTIPNGQYLVIIGWILMVAIWLICEAEQLADSWRQRQLVSQLRKGNLARPQPSDGTL